MNAKIKLTTLILLNLVFKWNLLLRIPSVISTEIELDESYDIIEGRVKENLDNLMNEPELALNAFHQFYHYTGFPHNLQPPDRDFVSKYMFSLMTSYEALEMYYALENGMIMGYEDISSFHLSIWYREPGMSYPIDHDNPQKDLYFDTCIDSNTGETQHCMMNEGDEYISCINGCELLRCNDQESQVTDCSSYESDNEKLVECESKIKWCENYETKRAVGNEGYIPLTLHCIDSQGAITETPGEAIIGKSNGMVHLGNCIYGLEAGAGSLVSRKISGPYAQCGPNKECSTTFIGGYYSMNYGK